jgi:acetolactate synthase small subunit
MQAFHIQYRDTQGTLMRILTAVSRRALDITYVHAQVQSGVQQNNDQIYKVTLLLDVNPKQAGQLRRDWYAIVDVADVRTAPAESIADHVSASSSSSAWPGAPAHPPASTSHVTDETARAARA